MAEGPSFLEKTVKWLVDDIEMEGTITYPDGEGKYPGLVFVAGSGPTDRNWCSPLLPGTNGSAKLLAEVLARNGYASMRYDKRASGPKVMENLPHMAGKISMKSHADELSGAVNAFIESGLADSRRLFALTNSEGAIHALNYYTMGLKPAFSGFILTGAPGRSVGEIARLQIHSQVKDLDNSDSIMKLYDASVSDFIEGRQVNMDPSLPDSARMLISGLANPANLPFSRELWTLEPAELFKKLDVPVLVIIGKKDLQVEWTIEGKELERAAEGKENYSFYYPENANHVLKYEEKARNELAPEKVVAEYNAPEKRLDPDTVNEIIRWLSLQ